MAGVNLGGTMAQPVTELDDIQGIVRSGYGSLVEAVFLLLRITDPRKAKDWIGASLSKSAVSVTNVADLRTRRDDALQIAFTAHGFRNLGLADDVVGGFSPEFNDGMASAAAEAEGRARRLGDVGPNAPSGWLWGADHDVPDALLMLYARAGDLAGLVARVKAEIAAGFAITREMPTTSKVVGGGDRLEHFGFIDGISQPAVDWKAERNPGVKDEMEYGNLVTPGEFLLGYTNEYGIYDDRPLLEPEQDPTGILATAADQPNKRDFARNGSYLVFRQLSQDVRGFWRFVIAQDPANKGITLAEAMIGRRLNTGDPLITEGTRGIAGVGPGEQDIRRNGFTFNSDKDGLFCPFGAHIRRANPRTADIPGGKQGFFSRSLRMLGFLHGGAREDLVSSARFHRILRRGRSYGDFVDLEASSDISGQETGLHFIALNASISRQFEFIQNAWLFNPTFDGMSGEADPLLGNRLNFPAGHSTDAFTIPQASGPYRRISGLPRFITVRGGAYFFLPGLRALRFLAQ
jgi:Dyp-type peroxidase family